MKRLTSNVISSLVLALSVLVLHAPGAGAVVPALIAKAPEDARTGHGAGQLGEVVGIAVDRDLPGDVYIADGNNKRIAQFTPWGEFVRAWGWGVKDGKEELETCTHQTACLRGLRGVGLGQFVYDEAVAVDGEGDIYVIDAPAHRVQKFDSEGNFLVAFGSAGTGPGQFSRNDYRNALAASPVTNTVFVAEGERVQVFEANGTFKEEIKMPSGKIVEAVAVDGVGKLYVTFRAEAVVYKLEPHGPTATFLSPVFSPEAPTDEVRHVAIDGNGHLYADRDRTAGAEGVLEFDPAGKCLDCGMEGEIEAGKGMPGFDRSTGSRQGSVMTGITATGACGSDDVYVARFKSSGGGGIEEAFFDVWGDVPDPVLCPPPLRAPSVDDQFVSVVETGEAIVGGSVNPHFWSGAVGSTRYGLEYASQACVDGGGWGAGCVVETPMVVLGGGSVNKDVPVSVRLTGLAAGTSYRYRFVAESSGAPGEEVFGLGGKPGSSGSDGTFTTFSPLGAQPACPANEAVRTGPSALLLDCRAFEMVSPVDKEGGDIVVKPEFVTALPAVLSESSVSGGRFAYGSVRSFGAAQSAPFTTQYVAARHAGDGWVSHAISPPRGENLFDNAAIGFDTEFKVFSPELCEAWFQSYAVLPGGPPVPPRVSELYRRSDEECGGPSYAPLNTVVPPVAEGEQFQIELQGVSGDEATAIFQADDELAEGGSPATITPAGSNVGPKQIYAVRGGVERFLCMLPEEGGAWTGPCTGGGGGDTSQGRSREGNVTGAISSDGNEVFWTSAVGKPGKIYLRENPFGAEGEECVEAGSPCTRAVSKVAEEEAGTNASQFWAAATGGSAALFTTGGRLYEYRVGDRSTHLIAGEVLGLMGQSDDLSRIYLASKEAKGGPNAEGRSASPGANNLYFYEGASFHFVGALAGDFSNLSPTALQPRQHTARVSGNGVAAAFMSTASLTGYDNTDAVSGEADAEVFLYDAAANGGAGKLVCTSCNPSGARPRGTLAKEGQFSMRAAGKIPVPENMFYPSRVLSDNGKRLFFESYDALTPRDTNGQKDVYEWEAPESGTCTVSSSDYSPEDQGCVALISSGRSARESSFVDASPSGGDVFFATLSSLVSQDPGLVDIYDARVDGGLPPPVNQGVACEGEACQTPAVSPADVTPGSLTFSGPGDLVSSPVSGAVKPKSKTLTRAQRLARALKACRRAKSKHKRVVCEAKARKAYGARRGSAAAHAGSRRGA